MYLLTGLAFGNGGLLPLATRENFTATGAEIGVILLLFTLGLESPPQNWVATLRTNAPTGLIDLVLNAAPGVAAALLQRWAGPASPTC